MTRWITGGWIIPAILCASQPNQIKTRIYFTGEPAIAVKSVTQIFNSLGYRFDIDTMRVENSEGEIDATAVGIRPFSAEVFAENLKESGIRIDAAALKQGTMQLTINVEKGVWNPQPLGSDEGIELKRTSSPQWFKVQEGQTIRIQPPYTGKWYPDIAVFDASMAVLYSLRSEKPKEELELELPAGAQYLKISNVNGMKVMQEGMWIESMSPGR